MKNYLSLFLLIPLLFISCDFFDDGIIVPIETNCGKQSLLDDAKYLQVHTNNYTVLDATINGDCLEVKISSSGCDPNNWDMNFIASEVVVETNPIEYKTKVELINNETCLVVFQKTVSFDLTPLQISGANQIQLNIDGWNTPVIYQY